MRNAVRIENFLNKVDIRDLLLNIWKVCDDSNIDQVEKSILDNILYIKEEWEFSCDLRFSQILVNLGHIPNTTGYWYYFEESDILRLQGCKPRDFIFWGSIFDREGNKLDDTKYSLVKDLEISHMQKIIDGGWARHDGIHKIISDELRMKLRLEKLKQLNIL